MTSFDIFFSIFLVVGLGGGMALSMYLALFYEPKTKKSKVEKAEKNIKYTNFKA